MANTKISSSINTLDYSCDTLSYIYYTSSSKVVLIRYFIKLIYLLSFTAIIAKYTCTIKSTYINKLV